MAVRFFHGDDSRVHGPPCGDDSLETLTPPGGDQCMRDAAGVWTYRQAQGAVGCATFTLDERGVRGIGAAHSAPATAPATTGGGVAGEDPAAYLPSV